MYPCFIKNLFLIPVIFLISCFGGEKLPESKSYYRGRLATSSGLIIKVQLAISIEGQSLGLSGKPKGSLTDNEGMLFVYREDDHRSFWMPDTYFDLDIFFLDKDLKIVYLYRKFPHHPGREEPPTIARTKPIFSRYILEMDALSPLSQKLKIGDSFKWLEKESLFEIKSKTHLYR